jgi:hypothetical protein
MALFQRLFDECFALVCVFILASQSTVVDRATRPGRSQLPSSTPVSENSAPTSSIGRSAAIPPPNAEASTSTTANQQGMRPSKRSHIKARNSAPASIGSGLDERNLNLEAGLANSAVGSESLVEPLSPSALPAPSPTQSSPTSLQPSSSPSQPLLPTSSNDRSAGTGESASPQDQAGDASPVDEDEDDEG